MKRFASTIDIQAPAQRIWALLTDSTLYPAWNPTVQSVEGAIVPGARIVVRPADNPKRAFPVKVSTFSPPHRMVWSGGMPLGLFRGERVFELTQTRADTVRFSMHETFSGPLSGVIGKTIPDLQPAFDDFAAALKRRAESEH